MPRNSIWNGKACFTTHVVTNHASVFTAARYSDIICDSLAHCQASYKLLIYGYVLMPDHLHLLVNSEDPAQLKQTLFNFRRFTAKALFERLVADRRKWALDQLQTKGNGPTFWEEDYRPIDASRADIFDQKLDYIHQNPVRTGFVSEPHHWKYSSAGDYWSGRQGPVSIDFIEGGGYAEREQYARLRMGWRMGSDRRVVPLAAT